LTCILLLLLSRTGQFGLGFNSCYHITDVPQFLSGRHAVIFDPHRAYLPDNSTGCFYDLTQPAADPSSPHSTLTLADKYHDQFVAPFKGIFGCDGRGGWGEPQPHEGQSESEKKLMNEKNHKVKDGTLFRLPFRSKLTAKKSEIKKSSKAASLDDVWKEVLAPFCERVQRRLLFLRAVELVEIFVWEEASAAPRRLLRCEVRPGAQPMAELRQHRSSVVGALKVRLSETVSLLTSLCCNPILYPVSSSAGSTRSTRR
jgi:sacsin